MQVISPILTSVGLIQETDARRMHRQLRAARDRLEGAEEQLLIAQHNLAYSQELLVLALRRSNAASVEIGVSKYAVR